MAGKWNTNSVLINFIQYTFTHGEASKQKPFDVSDNDNISIKILHV